MSILFIDGFGHYATADISYIYGPSVSVTIDGTFARRAGGQCLKLSAGATPGYAARALGSTPNTIVVGMAVKMTSFADDHQGFRLRRENVTQATVTINMDQSVSVKRGTYSGTVLGTSAAGLVPLNRYVYLEFKIYVHDSAGTYEVRLNDQVVLTGTGADTMGHTTAGVDTVWLVGQETSGNNIYIDDLYIDDATFWGDSRVDTLAPSGAGSSAEWTPSAGSNYENIDDSTSIDEDSSYNSTDVVDEVDSFALADLSPLGTEIYAVAINVTARKDDAGTRKMRPVCVMGAVEYTGDEVSLYDEYSNHQYIWESPPDAGSGSWTEADVNGAEFGYKLTE